MKINLSIWITSITLLVILAALVAVDHSTANAIHFKADLRQDAHAVTSLDKKSISFASPGIESTLDDDPMDIIMIGGTVSEDATIGTSIATFSTTDAEDDDGDQTDDKKTFTYTLVSGGGLDTTTFTFNNDVLITTVLLDFEQDPIYTIRVRSADNKGKYIEEDFTITVINVNEPPVAQNNNFQVYYGDLIERSSANNVLNNDSDVDGDPILLTNNLTPPSKAQQFIWYGDGTFKYQPEDGFLGVDSFTYEITDGEFYDTATVEIEVLDPSSPSISWIKPVGNDLPYYANYEKIVLEVNADDDIGIEYVWFYRYDADQDLYITIGYDDTAPYNAILDTTDLKPEDFNQISAKSYDANNESPQATIYIWLNPIHINYMPLVSR